MKDILSLNANEAREFFLKKESYCNFDLPGYFDFEKILAMSENGLGDNPIGDFYCSDKNMRPEKIDNINYKLLSNKDGKYAWRPLQLIHPVLYVYLVKVITTDKNWVYIKNRLRQLMNESKTIKCVSIPVVATYFKSDKAEQISRWVNDVEKESITLALDYDYLYHTDITDCYGSIYTHTIAWALHNKDVAKDNQRDTNLIGNQIDQILRSMSNGQTNGIPQGSVLMDFIAEIVLCYIDKVLYEKLVKFKKTDYKIIRFRDDYRIFTNQPMVAEKIIKELTDILNGFGMKVNSSKTLNSNNVIHSAIKSDKLELMDSKKIFDNFTSELYFITKFSQIFPNSGQLSVMMKKLYDKLDMTDKKDIKENIMSLISIVVDIAYKNPRVYSISSAVISKLLDFLSKKNRAIYMKKILVKFGKLPNTGIMQIWLQRITLRLPGIYDYIEPLCKRVVDDNIIIWNSDWLNIKFKNKVNSCEVVDHNILNKMNPIIDKKETDLFEKQEFSLQ